MKRFSGITEKHKKFSMILNALMLVIGAALAIASFTAKGSSGSMFTPAQDLPDGLRVSLLLGGILIFVDGLSNFAAIKKADKSYIQIDSGKVKGCQYSSVFFIPREERFALTYDQIAHAEVSNPSALTPSITIHTAHKTYTVCIADAQKAANLINSAK